jgi:uncharacterized protein (DUF58 family)
MKNHLLIPVILLFLLLLLGLLNLQGEVLALLLPLIVYIGAAFYFAPEKARLNIQLELSSEWISAGMPVTVRATVHNAGPVIDALMLTVPLPPGVELIEGNNVLLTSIPPGSDLELTFSIQVPRGEYPLNHILVKSGETFDLFWKEQNVDSFLNLRVRPAVLKTKSISIRPPTTRSFSGSIPSRQGGTGVGFFSLREYQSGDQQRHINWRICARHQDTLYTNTFQMERVADIGLILDARSHVYANAVGGDTLFEHSVKSTAALTSTFLNDGNRVGLTIYGGVIQRVFPGYGKIQRERIFKELVGAKIGHNYALKNLGYLPTRFFPTRSQIVLISPLTTDDIVVLVQLRAQGYGVILVCPDAIDLEIGARSGGGESVRDLSSEYAYRLYHYERSFLLQKVRRVGVVVVDWNVNEPLANVIHDAMLRQPVQHLVRCSK